MKRWLLTIGAAALCCLLGSPALAHKPSDSYLTLRDESGGLSGHWDIALRDLDRTFVLDENGDGSLTWGELQKQVENLTESVFRKLTIARGSNPCSWTHGELELVEHSDGPYARLPFTATCDDSSAPLRVEYDYFFDLDPQHRSVVRFAAGSSEEHTFVLTEQRRGLELGTGRAAPSALAFVREGTEHILGGLDHLLFLFALLLPAVLGRGNDSLDTTPQIRGAVRDVVKVVTAFTVAHSLTLGLAALGVVSMQARVIEPAIAASVALAALDNVRPVFGRSRWSIAFALGLLHGFGFSSALSDLGLSSRALLPALFGFNVGVELGQLAMVALFIPFALLLRHLPVRGAWLMRAGSLAIAAVSCFWLLERIQQG